VSIAEMSEIASGGRAAARETEATIEGLALAASEVRQNVSELEERVDGIANVVEIITDIAE
jgi:methyl-accepting chemotaxis protein